MTQLPESARRRLQTQAVGEHPDADLLTAFAEQALTGAERERVLTHLAACASCREVVSLALPQEAEPVEVGAPVAHSWFRWPVLRWTAVAATVIVVGAAVSVLTRRDRAVEITVPAREEPAPSTKTQVVQEPSGYVGAVGKDKAPQAGAAQEDKQRSQESPKGTNLQEVVTDRDLARAAESRKSDQLHAEQIQTQLAYADRVKKESARKDAPAMDAAVAQGALVGGQAGTAANKANNYQANAENRLKTAPAPVPPPPPPPQAQAPVAQNEAVMTIPAAPAKAYARQSEAAAAKKVAPEAGAATGPPIALTRARAFTTQRWRVSASGAVERSSDASTWEKVEIDPSVTFRAMSSNAGDLWAGGTGGSLFHSADAGRTWSRVKVGDEGMWVSDTITAVDFPSTRNGVVTTQSGAVWMTQDGGRTWQRRQ